MKKIISPQKTQSLNDINDRASIEELKKAAIDYIKRGYDIIPMGLNKNKDDYKQPLILWRKNGAITSVEAFEKFFIESGHKMFGIATVVKDRVFVDFDTKYTHKHFNIEPTPTIISGKGRHYWFKNDSHLNFNGSVDMTDHEKTSGKKEKMEVYTQSNRLEILPPSLHASGKKYEWLISLDDAELALLPEGILSLCKKKFSNNNLSQIPEGQRHNGALKAITSFGRACRGDVLCIRKKSIKWNTEKPKTPLEESELMSIVDWVSKNYTPSDVQSKPTKLRELILADKNIVLFHDQNKTPYVGITNDRKHTNFPIYSSEFSDYAKHRLYSEFNDAISDQQFKEVQEVLAAKARYEGSPRTLHHRVAELEGAVYYDLLDETGSIVRIDENGWVVMSGADEPYLFKAGNGLPQVIPVQGGDLRKFLELINIKDKQEQLLFLSTLPVRLVRGVDQAIAYIHGSAGSAKTTLLKLTKDLLDPSIGGISMPVRKIDDITVQLSHTWIFANDNISRIKDDLSDFFCVMATGAESSKRTLYKDSDLTILTVKNPAYLTGITVAPYKSDLLSRVLLFKTESIPNGKRKTNEDIWTEYNKIKPYLLGAVFETLSQAMKIRKNMDLKSEYRLADFAILGAACAEALGYGADTFESALQESIKQRAYDAIYSISAGRSIIEFMEGTPEYTGTVTDLFLILKDLANDDTWKEKIANSPSSFGKKLRELENSFISIGLNIDFSKRVSSERTIRLWWSNPPINTNSSVIF